MHEMFLVKMHLKKSDMHDSWKHLTLNLHCRDAVCLAAML